MADGGRESFAVEDHAYRLYRELGGDVNALPDYFVSALEMSAHDHLEMMAAVQPFVDTSISKTVNVPADYPFDAFEEPLLRSVAARPEGSRHLPAQRDARRGAVSVSPPQRRPTRSDREPIIDPLRIAIDHRPRGELPAIIEKVEYLTQAGKKSLYVAVSFIEVTGRLGGEDVTIERPIEFFIPTGQRDESQQWITATMRSLSLAARGGFVARNLQDMRKVSWDRGQVRLGDVAASRRTSQRRAGTIRKWRRSRLRSSRFCIGAVFSMPKAIRCRRACWRGCRADRCGPRRRCRRISASARIPSKLMPTRSR